jgi:N-acetylmuramate 1-kinase
LTDGAGNDWRELLADSPFAAWDLAVLKGDASGRRYARLTDPATQGSAILMDMGSEASEPFLRIAGHLRGAGLCVPELLWRSETRPDLMVITDLGPQHFADWITVHPDDELTLYRAAGAVMLAVQSRPPPAGLAALSPETGAAMLSPLFEWFVTEPDPAAEAQRSVTPCKRP